MGSLFKDGELQAMLGRWGMSESKLPTPSQDVSWVYQYFGQGSCSWSYSCNKGGIECARQLRKRPHSGEGMPDAKKQKRTNHEYAALSVFPMKKVVLFCFGFLVTQNEECCLHKMLSKSRKQIYCSIMLSKQVVYK